MATEKKAKEINVCPNCGHKLTGQEHLPSVKVLPQQVGLDYDPVAGRFLCPKCNYSGLPITMKAEEYSKAEFKNRKIHVPLARANPNYYRSILICVVALVIVPLIFSSISWELTILISFLIMVCLLYVLLRIPKYREEK